MKTNMNRILLSTGTVILVAALTVPARAQFFKQTNLVSDIPGMAALTDPLLVNPWGVSLGPTTPFWVSDAGKAVATLYAVNPTTGVVTKVPLNVSIPGRPSGQVFNGSTDFVVSAGGASGAARFIFAGLNGHVFGWNPGVPPPPTSTQAVDAATGTPPAVYTGIALGMRPSGQFLYAANPAGRRIDVYDHTFTKVTTPGSFTDPNLPAGDAPFNVANIRGRLFVSYTGPTGAINIFDTDGHFIRRFATGGTLLNSWGMVMAPAGFGEFSHALLVGNFNRGNPANGPGLISAFKLEEDDENDEPGEFIGLLKGTNGAPLMIDGLWALIFGTGSASGGNPQVLYFAAGIQNEAHGLFGGLGACHGPVISNASANPNLLAPTNQLTPVAINYSVADDCDPAPVCSLTVGSNGEDGEDGRGNNPDAVVVSPHAVELLASSREDGVVFKIAINCKDKLPLSSRATVQVMVARAQGHDH
jgi:uncharacterized protein (TIGR03118 family)